MTKPDARRHLLATYTNDPFQPVRLYYTITSRKLVANMLRGLKCILEGSAGRGWEWLFDGEAASLQFAAGYDAVPKEKRPIVLGHIRFPSSGGMILETNAISRAIAAARFFAPRLGSGAVLRRCRVVNRHFSADEGMPAVLMKTLDHNVSIIDPRQAVANLFTSRMRVRTMEEAERAAQASLEQQLASKKDVPLVEDFPLTPEEETPDFMHLATTLQFRYVRAFEHWRGNTHLTLTAIIVRTVEQGTGAQVLRSGHELGAPGPGQ